MIFIGGAATFSGAVTLGDETTDTVTISGTATLTVDLTVVNDAYFIAAVTIGDASTNSVTGGAVSNGAVTLGDSITDSITVNAVTTVKDGRCDRAVRVRWERCAE